MLASSHVSGWKSWRNPNGLFLWIGKLIEINTLQLVTSQRARYSLTQGVPFSAAEPACADCCELESETGSQTFQSEAAGKFRKEMNQKYVQFPPQNLLPSAKALWKWHDPTLKYSDFVWQVGASGRNWDTDLSSTGSNSTFVLFQIALEIASLVQLHDPCQLCKEEWFFFQQCRLIVSPFHHSASETLDVLITVMWRFCAAIQKHLCC